MSASSAVFSKERVAEFGKRGRPAKDPVRERVRIYRAAGPLILENGVRRTTIKAVARVAFLSPPGIYHYFRSKRQLALYGLEPEALSHACREEARELHGLLAGAGAPEIDDVIRLYVDKNLRMLDFVRPALHAAIELGRPELRRRLSRGIRTDADSLLGALRSLRPTAAIAEDSADSIRRSILALALDETLGAAEARRQLHWVFERLLPSSAR